MPPWLRNLAKEVLQNVYMRDNFLWRLPADVGAALALTFDDGPHPVHTSTLLDLLARQDIKATFFVIGRYVVKYPDLVRRIVAEGHGIGGHTFDHCEIVNLTLDKLAWELGACQRAIQDAAGIETTLFRPPRGKVNLKSIRQVARLGFRVVHWSKTYNDYQRDGSDELLSRIQRNPARAQDIVLLHDHNPGTVEALTAAISLWRSVGLTFQRL